MRERKRCVPTLEHAHRMPHERDEIEGSTLTTVSLDEITAASKTDLENDFIDILSTHARCISADSYQRIAQTATTLAPAVAQKLGDVKGQKS